MEQVRKEVSLGSHFSMEDFTRAFNRFREFYNSVPHRVLCSPDVIMRFSLLCRNFPDAALQHSSRFEHEGVPLCAAIVAPGTIILEGEVEENRMGDW